MRMFRCQLVVWLDEAVLAEVEREGARLERTKTWLFERALKIALPTLRRFPNSPQREQGYASPE